MRARTSLQVRAGPARGLPPRIYVPIVVVAALVFLGVIGYFLRIGLGVTGAALGPVAFATAQPGDVDVPQTGGNGVGGGTPVPANGGAPPAPVARLLVDLRGRITHDPRDVTALIDLGDLYADAAKFEQAQQYYKRALTIAPGRPGALFGEGVAARALGERTAAIAAFRGFLAIAPHDRRSPQAQAALRDLGA